MDVKEIAPVLVPRTDNDFARKKKAAQLSFNKLGEFLPSFSLTFSLLLSFLSFQYTPACVLLHLVTPLFPQHALHFYFLLFFSGCIFCRFGFKLIILSSVNSNTPLGHVNSVIIVFNFRPLGSLFQITLTSLFNFFYFKGYTCVLSNLMCNICVQEPREAIRGCQIPGPEVTVCCVLPCHAKNCYTTRDISAFKL